MVTFRSIVFQTDTLNIQGFFNLELQLNEISAQLKVFPNIWRLGGVRDTKFGTNISNEMLLHAAKCQGYSFNRFRVIKGKPTGEGKITPHPD